MEEGTPADDDVRWALSRDARYRRHGSAPLYVYGLGSVQYATSGSDAWSIMRKIGSIGRDTAPERLGGTAPERLGGTSVGSVGQHAPAPGMSPPSPDLRRIEAAFDCALLVVDGHGAIKERSVRAQRVLTSGLGLADERGFLVAQRGSAQRRLRDLARTASAAAAGRTMANSGHGALRADPQGRVGPVAIPDQEGTVRYVVGLFAGDANRDGGLVTLAIVDLASEAPLPRHLLRTVFNLSPREGEFAELFSLGLRIDVIAEHMGVSPHTAKIHLRQVLAKSGAAGQTELAHRLGRLRLVAVMGSAT